MKMRFVVVVIALLFVSTATNAAEVVTWRSLQPGVEYAAISLPLNPITKISTLHVVRIDPALAKLEAGIATEEKVSSRTAAAWCRTRHFSVATNLGMYDSDGRTHVGYLRHGDQLNNGHWNDYRSVLMVRRGESGDSATIVDREDAKTDDVFLSARLVVQNLRMIKGNGVNVWAASDRKWSEAAIASDSKGRILFLFTRAPYSMRELNALLVHYPLDIQRAMHVEGGPEASLSIHAGGIDLDLSGSYETGFWASDSNDRQWALPNVLGVMRVEK